MAEFMRYLLAVSLLFVANCGAAWKVRELYVVDVTNQVCAQYAIVDLEEIIMRHVRDLPLAPKGPCDRAAGFKRQDVNPALNFIRQKIKETK